MRTLCKVTMPVSAANRAVKDGLLPKVFEQTIAMLKPEAAYFTTQGGERTAMFIFDMKNSADMPVIAEPFFMQLDARVEFCPIMNAEDLRTGLANIPKR